MRGEPSSEIDDAREGDGSKGGLGGPWKSEVREGEWGSGSGGEMSIDADAVCA